jgi:hypothetical protein
MVRIPCCLDIRLTDGREVVSLTHLPRSALQKHFLVLNSGSGRVNRRTIVRQERSSNLKKFSDLIGTRTRDLPAASAKAIFCHVREISADVACSQDLCLRWYLPGLVSKEQVTKLVLFRHISTP